MRIPETPEVQRITWRRIAGEVLQQINLERGLGYTVRQLLLMPGAAMREYLFVDRRRMMKPFPFLLLTVGVATFLTLRTLPMGEELLAELRKDPDLAAIPQSLIPLVEWLTLATKQYFNLIYMSTLPAAALATYFVYRKAKLYLTEHLVINVYIFSIQTIFYLFFIPFITRSEVAGILNALLPWAYTVYALIRIFDQPLWAGIGRGLVVLVLTQLFYVVVIGVLAGVASVFIL